MHPILSNYEYTKPTVQAKGKQTNEGPTVTYLYSLNILHHAKAITFNLPVLELSNNLSFI